MPRRSARLLVRVIVANTARAHHAVDPNGPLVLQMGVPVHEHVLGAGCEDLPQAGARGVRRDHLLVAAWRSVTEPHGVEAIDDDRYREVETGKKGHCLLGVRLNHPRIQLARRGILATRAGKLDHSPVGVAAYEHSSRTDGAQELHRLTWFRTPGQVAGKHDQIDTRRRYLIEYRGQSRDVRMDVGQHRNPTGGQYRQVGVGWGQTGGCGLVHHEPPDCIETDLAPSPYASRPRRPTIRPKRNLAPRRRCRWPV